MDWALKRLLTEGIGLFISRCSWPKDTGGLLKDDWKTPEARNQALSDAVDNVLAPSRNTTAIAVDPIAQATSGAIPTSPTSPSAGLAHARAIEAFDAKASISATGAVSAVSAASASASATATSTAATAAATTLDVSVTTPLSSGIERGSASLAASPPSTKAAPIAYAKPPTISLAATGDARQLVS